MILGTTNGSTCNGLPADSDCLPSEAPSHGIGNLQFDSVGNLYATNGEAGSFNTVNADSLRAQNLDSQAGKLLRVRLDPGHEGEGVPGNPFYNASQPKAIRSKVWAYGLRNPYRFSLRPGSGVPYVGDVGWDAWEEINAAPAGANLGWPCYEGNPRQSGYQSRAECQALYAQGSSAVRPPLASWGHSGTSSAATGGVFYTGTAYPAPYQGAYFYGDYGQGFVRSLRVDGNDQLVAGSEASFATGADGPVAFAQGPDQNLYYLAINSGELRRWRYVGNAGPVSCPTGQFLAEYFNNRTLSGSASLRRCETQINNSWGPGGPGNGVNSDSFSVRWTGRFAFSSGTYAFAALIDDGIRLWVDGANLMDHWQDQGATSYTATRNLTSGEHEVKVEYYDHLGDAVAQVGWQQTAANSAPAVAISAPATTLHYKVGDVITYSGSATDPEDGALPSSALSWQVLIHHCPFGDCHTHPFSTSAGSTGQFTVPDHGDDSYFELRLTARDSLGEPGTAAVSLQPQVVPITLNSEPSGLQLVYGGTAVTTPYRSDTIPGSTHTIYAPSPQTVSGQTYEFAGWSDGGAQSHDVTVGGAAVSYTARWRPTSSQPPPNPVPTLTRLTPTSASAGGAAFTLTIAGANFVPGATAQWNGTARPTTVLSAAQLTVQIAAEDIASAGSATLTVVNPGPGGGTSNAQVFTIATARAAASARQQLPVVLSGTGLTR